MFICCICVICVPLNHACTYKHIIQNGAVVFDGQQVLNALYSVIDPELGIDVVNLGLIYGIDIDEGRVTITMTLTTPGCPLHESISSAVYYAIRTIAPEKEVRINLVWDPLWTPERLTDHAREMLGW